MHVMSEEPKPTRRRRFHTQKRREKKRCDGVTGVKCRVVQKLERRKGEGELCIYMGTYISYAANPLPISCTYKETSRKVYRLEWAVL